VLALVGLEPPPLPDEPLDVAALEACHHEVQALLVDAMPTIVEHPDARDAVVQLFRDRAERYPLTAPPRGGFGAHAAR
jgi:hypothetical protein